ncbi:hypothetical protein CTheo_9032 [Ceratobasidium theobromae]|uniref:Uncharacterized protein n=1 Tax=Ceratobasidium theobromae TaxID=1582974 RepID=A0A5N5Q755_9AGAM|nr:hypothetical protein CTheo_9032 [Ceratobasidium theobromae]
MENSAPPPVYSSSRAQRNEAPPDFEPRSSALPIPTDTKPPINHNPPAPSFPARARAPDRSFFLPPPPALIINNKHVGPFDLVTVNEVQAHLVFLGAFARLKIDVKSQKGVDVTIVPGSTESP